MQNHMQHDAERRGDSSRRASRLCFARKEARRAIAAMKKTVEISDGTQEFFRLLHAEFGKDVVRSWRCRRAVFEEATGLRLIHDPDFNLSERPDEIEVCLTDQCAQQHSHHNSTSSPITRLEPPVYETFFY